MIVLTANIRWGCLDFRALLDELRFVCLATQYPLVPALSRCIPLSAECIFQILRNNEYFL